MNVMMKRLMVFLVLGASLAVARAPRIWLTPTLLAKLQAKYAANTPDWQAFIAVANRYKGRTVAPYSDAACSGSTSICYNGGYQAIGGTSYQGSSYLQGGFYLSLAYQVTGDTGYSDTAIQILEAIDASWDGRSDCSTYAAGTIPMAANDGWSDRTYQVAVALIYDWNNARLSTTDQTNAATTTYCMYQWGAAHANDWPTTSYPGANYYGGHLLGFGLSAIAMTGDNSLMTTLYGITLGWWNGAQANSVVTQFTSGVYQNGYNPESYTNYGANHIERLLLYALAIQTYTGSSIMADYPNRLFHNELYNIMPGRQRITGESDWIGPGVGDVPGVDFNLYAYLLNGTADGAYAQYLWNNLPLGLDGTNRQTLFDAETVNTWDDPFFFGDTSRTATDYSTVLPPWFAGVPYSDGHTYVRSDWTDSAVWASYIGGIAMGGGHEITMAGTVQINRGGDYLLPQIADWWGTNGVTGTPGIYDSPGAGVYRGNSLYFYDYPYPYNSYGTLSTATAAGATSFTLKATAYVTCGNVIGLGRGTGNAEYVTLTASHCGSGTATLTTATPLVNSHASGEHLDTNWNANYISFGATYFGGQTGNPGRGSFAPWAGVPDVMAAKQTSNFSYTLSQLTGAYDQVPGKLNTTNRTLRSYYRTFVWMGGGYFVVKDRAISHAARAGVSTYDKLLFWHLSPGTTPAWTAPTVSGSRVTTATIGSSKLVIDTLLPASPSLTIRETDAGTTIGSPAIAQINAGRADANIFETTPVVPLTYRLEVRDPAPSDTFSALTVLSALGSTVTPPAVSAVTSISSTHEGAYIADATPRLAILPIDDTQQYSTVSFTQAMTGTASVLVAGLSPVNTYNVQQNGTTILTAQVVGTDGTLYFAPSGGGSFAITVSSPAPPTAPTITTVSLPDGTVGTAYSQTLTASGSTPITWSIVSGSLPSWATLNTSTGAITGTPDTAAVTSFTVQATNSAGSATQPLSITVVSAIVPPTVTTTSLPNGVIGVPYYQVLSATGSLPITWSIIAGSLPSWAALTPSSGEIAGTPDAIGTTSFVVEASNTGGASNQALSITITVRPPTISGNVVVSGRVVLQ